MQPSNYAVKGLLKYLKGSSSVPQAGGHCIVLNLCDHSGNMWDKNSVLGAVNNRWPKAGQEYRRWYLGQYKFLPGEVQEVNVQSTICLVNAIVFDQDGVLDANALTKAIDRVGEMAYDYGSSVHIQKQGEDNIWSKIENLLVEKIIKRSKNVYVYNENN